MSMTADEALAAIWKHVQSMEGLDGPDLHKYEHAYQQAVAAFRRAFAVLAEVEAERVEAWRVYKAASAYGPADRDRRWEDYDLLDRILARALARAKVGPERAPVTLFCGEPMNLHDGDVLRVESPGVVVTTEQGVETMRMEFNIVLCVRREGDEITLEFAEIEPREESGAAEEPESREAE